MADFSQEIAIIVLLAVINGVFAMSEVALLSARRMRLQHLADRGNERARDALLLLQDPNNFLSTVQIGVTLVGVFAGAFGGATLAKQVAARLESYPALAPYAQTIAFTIVVVLITYLSLVVGELVPKRIALSSPERIAATVSRPMSWLSRAGGPLVKLLSLSTDALLWILRVKESKEPHVTEEDVRALVRMGTQTGVFEETEQQLVEGVFRFADRKVTAIMTRRSEIEWLDINDSAEVLREEIWRSRHARLPVCDKDLDHVLGIVSAKEYLVSPDANLRDLLRQPIFVPENISALRVLDQFHNSPVHIALVSDEYGGVQGLVSTTDLLEALVGELPGENPEEAAVVKRGAGSWLIDGALPAEDLRELLEVDQLPGYETNSFQTAAGFMIHHLRKIPKTSEHFDFGPVRMEVVDMDGNRIDKILVTRRPPESGEHE